MYLSKYGMDNPGIKKCSWKWDTFMVSCYKIPLIIIQEFTLFKEF